MLAEDRDDGAHRGQRLAEQRLALDLLTRRGERAQNVLLGLRAETAERAQPLGLRRLLQLTQGRHAELLPDSARRLRPEPREVHELDDVGRNAVPPLRQRRDLPVLDDLDDLLLDHLADPGELLGLALHGQLRDRPARLAHTLRRPPVGERPELVAALELEEVGQELELLGDLRVAGKCLRHPGDDMDRCAL